MNIFIFFFNLGVGRIVEVVFIFVDGDVIWIGFGI